MYRAFLKILFFVQFIFFLLMSFYSLDYIEYIVVCGSELSFRIGLTGLIFVVGLFACIIWFALKHKLEERSWIWPLIVGTIFVIQLAGFFFLKPLPVFDCRSVLEEAVLMISNGFQIEPQNGYFERYANNYPFTILMAAYFWVLAQFNVQNFWLWAVVANCIFLDLAIIIAVYLLSRIRSRRVAMVFLLITAICPITYTFCWYVYTNIFSIFMMMLILLCAYKAIEAKDDLRLCLLRFAILGVVLVLAYLIRATAVFVFIALVMCFVLCRQRTKSGICYRTLFLGVGTLALTAILAFNAYKLIENCCVDDALREKNFPLTHWVMMGQNREFEGKFVLADEDFTESIPGKEAKMAANLKVLKERIIENKDDMPEFLLFKLYQNWSQTGYIVRNYASHNQHFGWLYSLLGGNNSLYFLSWVQIFYSTIYLLAAISVLKLIRSDDPPFYASALVVTIFGAVIFYLIWEVSWLYNVCFVPLIIMLASFAPSEHMAEWKLKKLGMHLLPMLLVMLLAGQLASKPDIKRMMINKSFMYDDYSVSSLVRREDLEEQIDTIARDKTVIQDGFRVHKGDLDAALRFYVDIKDDVNGCDYLFSLYDDNGGLIHQQLLDYRNPKWKSDDLYPCVLALENPIGEGNYSFTIEAVQDGREDGLGFAYAWHRVGADQNPGGELRLSGQLLKDRELLFDVA